MNGKHIAVGGLLLVLAEFVLDHAVEIVGLIAANVS